MKHTLNKKIMKNSSKHIEIGQKVSWDTTYGTFTGVCKTDATNCFQPVKIEIGSFTPRVAKHAEKGAAFVGMTATKCAFEFECV